MIDGTCPLTAVTVDERHTFSCLHGKRLELLLRGNGPYGIVHQGLDHAELPRKVGSSGCHGRTSAAWSGVRVDVMHEDSSQIQSRPLGYHGPYSVGDGWRYLHKIVGYDAHLLTFTVLDYKTMSPKVLMYAVGKALSCGESRQDHMLFRSGGDVRRTVIHLQAGRIAPCRQKEHD